MSFLILLRNELTLQKYSINETKGILLGVSFNNIDVFQNMVYIYFKENNTLRFIYKILKYNLNQNVKVGYKEKHIFSKGKYFLVGDIELLNFFNLLKRKSTHWTDIEIKHYLIGIFLSFGQCSNPRNSSFCLSFNIKNNYKQINFFENICWKYLQNQGFKKYQKPNNYTIYYLKKYSDVVKWFENIKLYKCLLHFEECKIEKDYLINITRANNIDISNAFKTRNFSERIKNSVNKLSVSYLNKMLPRKTIIILNLKLDFPDDSLQELTIRYYKKYREGISRTTIYKNLQKIINMDK